MTQASQKAALLFRELMCLPTEERNRVSDLLLEKQITETYSFDHYPAVTKNEPQIIKTEISEDTCETLIDSNELSQSEDIPPWVLEYEEDSKKVYSLNLANFDFALYIGDGLHKFCIEGVKKSTWSSYNKQIKHIVVHVKNKLESFYSTDASPKATPKVTSTERHYISASFAFKYPLMTAKYIEFKNRFLRKEDIGCTVYMSTFKSQSFMEFFYEKLSKQLAYVPREVAEHLGPQPKKKQKVSEAMKRNAKENRRRKRIIVSCKEDFEDPLPQ